MTAAAISIVIPVYRGAQSIGPLVERLFQLPLPGLQVVLVNDDSPDESHEVCLGLHARFAPRLVYLRLSRNFGEHNAVMAGLHHAAGDYVVIMDDDFQNPPEEALRLAETAAAGGFDVVYTQYPRKAHSWARNLGSRFNDLVATWMLGKPRDLYLSSFKCISRFAVRQILAYAGPYPYIDGLLLRCTRRIGRMVARHEPRREGESGYTFRKLVRLWLNMFVNFSVMPLRMSAFLGFLFSLAGVILAACVVLERLANPQLETGWASTAILIIVFAGVQLVMLGLIGEYIGRLFLSTNQTPQFIVRDLHGGEGGGDG